MDTAAPVSQREEIFSNGRERSCRVNPNPSATLPWRWVEPRVIARSVSHGWAIAAGKRAARRRKYDASLTGGFFIAIIPSNKKRIY